jgi:hypothetical protein
MVSKCFLLLGFITWKEEKTQDNTGWVLDRTQNYVVDCKR